MSPPTHLPCPHCRQPIARTAILRHVRTEHAQPVEPEVLNKADFIVGGQYRPPPHSTYCGRGTPFGNPYHVGVDGTRDEVIDRFIAERSLDSAFLALVRERLGGQHLVCHCAPERCHCDWLKEVANP